MPRRAGLRRRAFLTDLTERSVIGVTRARTRARTVETESSVRSVRTEGNRPAKGERLLRDALAVITGRRKQYGEASVLHDQVASRWSITLGQPVTPAQVVLCLIDLKLSRLAANPRHRDSAIDVAGYVALLEELG